MTASTAAWALDVLQHGGEDLIPVEQRNDLVPTYDRGSESQPHRSLEGGVAHPIKMRGPLLHPLFAPNKISADDERENSQAHRHEYDEPLASGRALVRDCRWRGHRDLSHHDAALTLLAFHDDHGVLQKLCREGDGKDFHVDAFRC